MAAAWPDRTLALAGFDVFGTLGALRRALYRSGIFKTHRFDVPVMVVGNVVAGGSGKTPVMMAIASHLMQRGKRVGIVSRGYGRRTGGCRAVEVDSHPADVGDEPLLIRRSTGAPVFVAARRVEAVSALLAAHPNTQVIVSDDGLQHLALGRDIEICVFDDRGVGNGWLLPAGPLREPWPRACDLVLHTGSTPAFKQGFASRRSLGTVAVDGTGREVALDDLRGRPSIAVAAIAKPQAFFEMLRQRGIRPERSVALPDHDDFSAWTIEADGMHTLLCTEKDAVKLWRHRPDALAVPLVFEPDAAFLAALDAKLSSRDGHQAA